MTGGSGLGLRQVWASAPDYTHQSYRWLRVLAAMLAVSLAIALLPPLHSAAALVAAVVALLILARPDLGLALLALAIPFGSVVEARTGSLPAGPTEAIVGLALAGWLAAVLTRRADRIAVGPLVWPLLLFLGVGLLSMSFAASPAAAPKELLRWAELLITYVVAANVLRDARSRRLVLAAVLVAGSAEALLGLAQFALRVGPPSFRIGPFLRAYGTFGQPNPFAGYLGLVWPLALALALLWRPGQRDWLRRLCWPALGVMLVAVVASLSRGAWLGALVAGAVVALALGRRSAGLAVAAGLAGASLLLLGAVDALPGFVAQRLAPVVSYFRIFDARGVYPYTPIFAIVERMAHWQAAWEMLVDHPWLGVGPGSYVVAYPTYAILPFWKDPLGHAHNIYLNVAAETGVVGLAAYLAVLASWLWAGLAAARSARGSAGFGRALALGVVACLGAAAAHNLFDNLYVHGMNAQVGLLLGLLAGVGGQRAADVAVEG